MMPKAGRRQQQSLTESRLSALCSLNRMRAASAARNDAQYRALLQTKCYVCFWLSVGCGFDDLIAQRNPFL